MTFQELNLSPVLMDAVQDIGFTVPSPIQEKTIPAIREGRDVLANAQTGSGKTAAFLIPLMENLMTKKRGTTRVLVLAPTRELALQIAEHFGQLSGGSGLSCAAVFGGVGMNPQVAAFRKGVDIVVATPGRLLDHMKEPYAQLPGLEHLVIDEADRMFDMGFLPDMRRILSKLPSRRQTMMFSATLPDPIVQLSKDVLTDPVRISIPTPTRAAGGITHSVFPVSGTLKMDLLLQILKTELEGNAIVFTRTKYRADKVAKFLHRNGIPSDRIHGNRSQPQRNATLAGFKSGKFRVLVATDIAARGIDVEELRAVVNFDIPNVPEEYIHRVGRTARASATGDALSLVSPEEENDFKAIERHMNTKVTRKTMGSFDYSGKSFPAPERDVRFEKGSDGNRGGNRGQRTRPPLPRTAPASRASQPAPRPSQPAPRAPRPAPRAAVSGEHAEIRAEQRAFHERQKQHGERSPNARDPRPEPAKPRRQDRKPVNDKKPSIAGKPGEDRKPAGDRPFDRKPGGDRGKPAGRPAPASRRGHTAAYVPPPVKPKKGYGEIEAADWIERAVIEAEMRKAERNRSDSRRD